LRNHKTAEFWIPFNGFGKIAIGANRDSANEDISISHSVFRRYFCMLWNHVDWDLEIKALMTMYWFRIECYRIDFQDCNAIWNPYRVHLKEYFKRYIWVRSCSERQQSHKRLSKNSRKKHSLLAEYSIIDVTTTPILCPEKSVRNRCKGSSSFGKKIDIARAQRHVREQSIVIH